MHELSIAERIVEMATEAVSGRNASRITCLEVEVGVLSGVEPDSLVFALESFRQQPLFTGTNMNIIRIPAVAICSTCGAEYEPTSWYDTCPACGISGFTLRSGEELRLKSVLFE